MEPSANCDVYEVLFDSGQSFSGVYVGVGAEKVNVAVPLLVVCVAGELVPFALQNVSILSTGMWICITEEDSTHYSAVALAWLFRNC